MTEVAIKIPDDLGQFIEESVRSGAFNDAGDFLLNLLYNVKAQRESELSGEQLAKLAVLRSEVALGLNQAERGEFVEFTADEIISAGQARRAASLVS